jgi:hypothetical protein
VHLHGKLALLNCEVMSMAELQVIIDGICSLIIPGNTRFSEKNGVHSAS